MALEMQNAKYARNYYSKDVFIDSLKAEANRIKKIVTGEKYEKLLATINNNWQGQDANNFAEIIRKRAADIQSKIDKTLNTIIPLIEEDYKSFRKFQDTNVK